MDSAFLSSSSSSPPRPGSPVEAAQAVRDGNIFVFKLLDVVGKSRMQGAFPRR